jgi:surfactin synthase thioesterase subunit
MLPRQEFLAEVERRYGPIPPEIRNAPEFLDLLLPVLRADLQMYETYQHVAAAPLDVPVLALGGNTDAIVSRAQVLDWRAYTRGEFVAEILPGGHFFPQDDVRLTTERVRTFLGRHVLVEAGPRSGFSSPVMPHRPTALSGCQ